MSIVSIIFIILTAGFVLRLIWGIFREDERVNLWFMLSMSLIILNIALALFFPQFGRKGIYFYILIFLMIMGSGIKLLIDLLVYKKEASRIVIFLLLSFLLFLILSIFNSILGV